MHYLLYKIEGLAFRMFQTIENKELSMRENEPVTVEETENAHAHACTFHTSALPCTHREQVVCWTRCRPRTNAAPWRVRLSRSSRLFCGRRHKGTRIRWRRTPCGSCATTCGRTGASPPSANADASRARRSTASGRSADATCRKRPRASVSETFFRIMQKS